MKKEIINAWTCSFCDKKFPGDSMADKWSKIQYLDEECKRLFEVKTNPQDKSFDLNSKYLNHLHVCPSTKRAFCPKKFCIPCRMEVVSNPESKIKNYEFFNRSSHISHCRTHHKNGILKTEQNNIKRAINEKPKHRRTNLEIRLTNEVQELVKQIMNEREDFIINDEDISIKNLIYKKVSKEKKEPIKTIKKNETKYSDPLINKLTLDNLEDTLKQIASVPDEESSDEEEPNVEEEEPNVVLKVEEEELSTDESDYGKQTNIPELTDDGLLLLDYECHVSFEYFVRQLIPFGVDFSEGKFEKKHYDFFVCHTERQDYLDNAVVFDPEDLIVNNVNKSPNGCPLEILFERVM
jgi:hypothetical protein